MVDFENLHRTFITPDDMALEEIGELSKVRAALKVAGINTYGELKAYSRNHDFSKLEGIGGHNAEEIHRVIHRRESTNKRNEIRNLQNRLEHAALEDKTATKPHNALS